jgi:hypothetical protein
VDSGHKLMGALARFGGEKAFSPARLWWEKQSHLASLAALNL